MCLYRQSKDLYLTSDASSLEVVQLDVLRLLELGRLLHVNLAPGSASRTHRTSGDGAADRADLENLDAIVLNGRQPVAQRPVRQVLGGLVLIVSEADSDKLSVRDIEPDDDGCAGCSGVYFRLGPSSF